MDDANRLKLVGLKWKQRGS